MKSTMVESTFRYSKKERPSAHSELRRHFVSNHHYLMFKRGMDISTSLLVILLVFPWLFPILFIAIRLDSRGPVFFKQKRIGFLGRTFSCYKFRTMYRNDAADTLQAIKDDPRVTRTGRLLRGTGLDELPQFINVLLGHMSIVGPRPHMLKDSREFSNVIPGYRFRNLVRPGITGMSQVRGCRGPASTFQSIFHRYQWDAYYVRNIGPALDIRIMAETAWLMLRSFWYEDETPPEEIPVPEHYTEHHASILHSNKVIAD